MNQEPTGRYRHGKRDQIAELLTEGHTDTEISRRLSVGRRAIARIRGEMGIAPSTNSTTKQAKYERCALPPDEDGHVGWAGRMGTSGNAAIRHLRIEIPASHVAFEIRTGRPPIGVVKSECGIRGCLTPAHLSDEIERRTVRMQERALHGRPPQPWDVCSKGLHGWEEHGRILPGSLEPYCRACGTERWREMRTARKEVSES